MKINELVLDKRIKDDTTIIIRESTGKPITTGFWFEDNIFTMGQCSATLEFLDDKNLAIIQLV